MKHEIGPKRTIGEASTETLAVRARLAATVPGEIVAYVELARLANGDIQNEKRYCLTSALNSLLANERYVFDTIRNVGVRRVTFNNIEKTTSNVMKSIRGKVRRASSKLACVTTEERLAMSPAERIAYDTRTLEMGAVAQITKPSVSSRIEQEVRAAKTALPRPEDLLGMFATKQR